MSSLGENWCCPYCNHHTVLRAGDLIVNTQYALRHPGEDQSRNAKCAGIQTEIIYCRNTECECVTATAELSFARHVTPPNQTGRFLKATVAKFVRIMPASSAKPWPDYIPRAIVSDYEEACLIADLSPKAAATLARRCLQGMIRDFWGIRKRSLNLEIQSLKGKVDPETWKAMDAVRSLGNIGAHMEKKIDVIVEVDPDEAGLLIRLIETLLAEWYVRRHERDEAMKQIATVASEKKKQAKGGVPPTPDAKGVEAS